jgi:putative hydrolases of HD superfamily
MSAIDETLMTNIEALLPFIKEIDRLKKVERQALIHNGGRRENSAEHSWHLALSVLVMSHASEQPLDICKAVKMALLHDIVEIDAGDTFVYSETSKKKETELAAIHRLTALLPANIGNEFKNIWMEFEEGISKEAQFVGALDRFLPIYSNVLNEGYSWKAHQISEARVVGRNKPSVLKGLPALWPIIEKMLTKAVQLGHLQKD